MGDIPYPIRAKGFFFRIHSTGSSIVTSLGYADRVHSLLQPQAVKRDTADLGGANTVGTLVIPLYIQDRFIGYYINMGTFVITSK